MSQAKKKGGRRARVFVSPSPTGPAPTLISPVPSPPPSPKLFPGTTEEAAASNPETDLHSTKVDTARALHIQHTMKELDESDSSDDSEGDVQRERFVRDLSAAKSQSRTLVAKIHPLMVPNFFDSLVRIACRTFNALNNEIEFISTTTTTRRRAS